MIFNRLDSTHLPPFSMAILNSCKNFQILVYDGGNLMAIEGKTWEIRPLVIFSKAFVINSDLEVSLCLKICLTLKTYKAFYKFIR